MMGGKDMKWYRIGKRTLMRESAEDKSIKKEIESAYTHLIDLEYKIEKTGYMASNDALLRQIRSLTYLMEHYI